MHKFEKIKLYLFITWAVVITSLFFYVIREYSERKFPAFLVGFWFIFAGLCGTTLKDRFTLPVFPWGVKVTVSDTFRKIYNALFIGTGSVMLLYGLLKWVEGLFLFF